MKQNLWISFGFLLLCFCATDARWITKCYAWQDIPRIQITCASHEVIHIQSVGAWRQRQPAAANSNFCDSPYLDRNADCFTADAVNENSLFQHCNFRTNCSKGMLFAANQECSDQGFMGQRYFHVEYECLLKDRNWNPVLFETMKNMHPQTFASTSLFHLTTEGYPSYITSQQTVCLLTLAGYSKLVIKTYELRSYNTGQDSCPYRLYINNNETQYTNCAKEIWNTTMSTDMEYINTESANQTIQIAFEKSLSNNNIQGKVWLQFQSFSTVSALEESNSITHLFCDFSTPIWPRPAGQSTTSTTTTTTTTTTASTSVVNSQGSSSLPGDTPPLPRTTRDPAFPGQVQEVDKVKSKEDDKSDSSLIPVIGGVVAGGVVILLIVIIVIVLLVRRYNINHTPPKSLEVIDAWDDVSTLSKPEKPISHISNGSAPMPYYDQSSPTTTDTDFSPYDDSFDTRHSYMNGEMYAEIPEPPGVKSSTRSLNGHHGYIFEDDLYSDLSTTKQNGGHKVLMNGGGNHGNVFHASLDRKRISELYAKPLKPKRKQAMSTSSMSSGGFDNPHMAADIYESAHRFELKTGDDEEIYGYSTSLA